MKYTKRGGTPATRPIVFGPNRAQIEYRFPEQDDLGLLNEVTRLISSDMNVNINKINLETENGLFSGFISVSVQNKKILDRLTKNLTKLKGIEKVKRE